MCTARHGAEVFLGAGTGKGSECVRKGPRREPMEKMSKEYEVVQIPGGIRRSSLPPRIEIGKAFEVNGELYVCEKSSGARMKVCSEDEGRTTVPVESKGFYVIRRM